MKKSRELGMQTFDQALFDLYEAGVISYERIGVQHCMRGDTPNDGGDLGEIGDRADLVVDSHDADHRDGLGRGHQRTGERIEVDTP